MVKQNLISLLVIKNDIKVVEDKLNPVTKTETLSLEIKDNVSVFYTIRNYILWLIV